MRISKDEASCVLRISGALRIDVAGELQDALRDLVGAASRPAVDLSEVEECDTAALQLLCSARRTAARAGKPFELVGLSAAIREASEALGLSLAEEPDSVQYGGPEGGIGVKPVAGVMSDGI